MTALLRHLQGIEDLYKLGLICPATCGGEAAWLGSEIEILAGASLLALINHFNGAQVVSPPLARLAEHPPHCPEFTDIEGQETAKRRARDRRGGRAQPAHVISLYPKRNSLLTA